eukprot:SAG31_NODE_120_length_23892_cov_10.545623_25_plen_137_part_00
MPVGSALSRRLSGDQATCWRWVVLPLLRKRVLQLIPLLGPLLLAGTLYSSYAIGQAHGGWSAADGHSRCERHVVAASSPPQQSLPRDFKRLGGGFCRGESGRKPNGLRGSVCDLDSCLALCHRYAYVLLPVLNLVC